MSVERPSLLPSHASESNEDEKSTPDVGDESGQIFAAVMEGRLDFILERENQVNILALRDQHGYSTLHWAVYKNKQNVVVHLLDKGMDPDVSSSATGQSPLHWAAFAGHLHMAMLLIERGASLAQADGLGYQAIHHAAQAGKSLLLHFLLMQGASIEARDNEGHTPLHWAAYQNRGEATLYLIGQGCDVNATDRSMCSALHWAAIRNNPGLIEHLVSAGGSTATCDENGLTPSECALQNGSLECYQRIVASSSEDFRRARAMPARQKRNNNIIMFWLPTVLFTLFIYPFFSSSWLAAIGSVILAIGLIVNYKGTLFAMEKGLVSPFPVGCVIAATIYLWGAGVLYFLPATFVSNPVPNLLFLATSATFWYFLANATMRDPGFVNTEKVTESNVKAMLSKGLSQKTFCATCCMIRPRRSKHCRVCDRCVALYDHHCPWVNNCIGANNHHHFFSFVASVVINSIVLFWVAYVYHTVHEDAPYISHPIDTFLWYWTNDRFALLTVTLNGWVLFWLLALTLYQGQNVLMNLTTNERINKHRYGYLRDPESRQFRNPYDKGVVQNCITFYSRKHSDKFPPRNLS
eukprot:TRINITY_DN11566_c0_g1_i1.p1 TRINITY_DN11566_c0_g1~~TRINITY_DN11566_c0_g1_i1.p1  ORF type:complete len:579 (-),score=103.08 TRINITY_DN11566_c0_g1_i1:167-1903(-)